MDSILAWVADTILPLGLEKIPFFEKKYQPGKKFKFVPVKPTFPPVKKNQKSAREKNKWA